MMHDGDEPAFVGENLEMMALEIDCVIVGDVEPSLQVGVELTL